MNCQRPQKPGAWMEPFGDASESPVVDPPASKGAGGDSLDDKAKAIADKLNGVGIETARSLVARGFDSVEEIKIASTDERRSELIGVSGVTKNRLNEWFGEE